MEAIRNFFVLRKNLRVSGRKYVFALPTGESPSRRSNGHCDSATFRVRETLAYRFSTLPLHQLVHQQHPQFTQLVDRQRYISLLARQVIRQVK